MRSVLPGRRNGRAGLFCLLAVCPLLLGAGGPAPLTATTAAPASLGTANLDAWLPAAVTTARVTATSCRVSWTPSGAAAAGTTYDVSDGAGSPAATAIAGTTATITVPVTATTPTVRVRQGAWLSRSSAGSSACAGYPAAPPVTATPSTGQLVVDWTAPADNGDPVASYLATISPGGGTCVVAVPAARSCTFAGLTDGVNYTVSVSATNGSGTGVPGMAAAIPYPSTIMTPARLRLWLDGADPQTLLGSASCTGAPADTAVGCWRDKSGQGNDASQPTPANQPSRTPVTGFSVPDFDGSASYLRADPTLLPTGTTTGTMIAVAALTDPSPSTAPLRSVVNYGTLLGGQARQIQKAASSSAILVSTGFDASQGTWSSSPGIVAGEFTPSTETIWSSGRQPGATLTGMSNNTGTTYANIGSSGTPGQFWHGPIPEIIAFTGALTDAERRTIEEYLGRKWSVPITPQAPAGAAAVAGSGSATVSWAAPDDDGGSAVTSYAVAPVAGAGSCSWSSGTTATCTGLTPGSPYSFTVRALNGVGSGPAAGTAAVVP